MRTAWALCAVFVALIAICSGCSHAPAAVAKPPLLGLYPPIADPRSRGWLEVSANHSLYYEESGNPAGKPIVFLHGGPGSGTKPKQRQWFDPEAYRIILYDQAGSGLSRAADPLKENTTADLVRHLELLRQHLGVEKWVLFGGSWGSTLALAYAERYPQHVSGIITWGVFFGRPWEIDWLYKEGGISRLFPEAFADFASFVPPRERGALIKAYLKRFASRDPLIRREAVRRWTAFEDIIATVPPSEPDLHTQGELDDRYLRRARIEATYMLNGAFADSRHGLLERADRLHGIPVIIVAGRYDLVCPHASAYDLKRALPEAELRTVELAGHLSTAHPEIMHELVSATDRLR